MAGNPRIDDLRRRLEKDPGSRLFAQLAEELRKDGDLEEAINVCREGLKRQPAYPSARMTLGRALFDTGDLAAARAEFETVLKGAPDNILASRLLAESLEGLGDLQGAARQYKTTLALAPGDKQVQAHLDALEKGLKAGGTAAPAPAPRPPVASVTPPTIIMAPPSPPSAASAATVRAPRPPELTADTSPDKFPMPEPEPSPPPPVQRDYAPIPLVAADETFELEAAHESPATRVGGGAGAAGADWVVGVAMPMPAEPPAAAPPVGEAFPMPDETLIEEPKASPAPREETAFELEQPYESPVTQWATPSPPPAAEEPRPPAEPATDFAEEFAPPEPPPRPIGAPLDLPPLPAEPPPPLSPPPPAAAVPEPPIEAAPAPLSFEPPPPAPPIEAAPAPAPAAPFEPPPAEPAPPEPDLSSATLAELYFNQGFTDKALDVYRQLLDREPGNERARARTAELEALDRHLRAEEARGPQPEPGAAADPAAARRKAIERTIARLEAMLAAVKKEQP